MTGCPSMVPGGTMIRRCPRCGLEVSHPEIERCPRCRAVLTALGACGGSCAGCAVRGR